MAFLETQGPAQIAIFCTMGVLSIIGCLIYLYSHFFLQPTKSYARRLIACIAFSEGIMTFWMVSGMIHMSTKSSYADYALDGDVNNCDAVNYNATSTQFCQVQAFITNYFSIASFVYNAGLAVFMLQLTCCDKPCGELFYAINILAWVIPTIESLIVANEGMYGYSICTTGGWCWLTRVQDNGKDIFWLTFAGKLWEQSAEVIMIVSYILLKIVLEFKKRRSLTSGATHDVIQKLETLESLYFRLALAPVFFTLCNLFGTVRSYVLIESNANVSDTTKNFLSFMHGFGNNATGLCNFIIFVLLQRTARQEVKNQVIRGCYYITSCCCFRFNSHETDHASLIASLNSRLPKPKRDSSNSIVQQNANGVGSKRSRFDEESSEDEGMTTDDCSSLESGAIYDYGGSYK